MRLIDADELMEHVGRDRLDSRELIMEMINNARTVDIFDGVDLESSPKYERTIEYLRSDIKRAKDYDEPLVFTTKGTAEDALWLLEEYGRREWEIKQSCAVQKTTKHTTKN